jgi:hypothetical protein
MLIQVPEFFRFNNASVSLTTVIFADVLDAGSVYDDIFRFLG